MLDLDSPRWARLTAAGGSPLVVVELLCSLRAQPSDRDWAELCEQLCHGWTLVAQEIVHASLALIHEAFESATLFGAAVHRGRFDGDPERRAIENVYGDFVRWLSRQGDATPPQRGIPVLPLEFHGRAIGRHAHAVFGQTGCFPGFDAPLFADVSRSRLAQYAEHVAFALHRHFNEREPREMVPQTLPAPKGRQAVPWLQPRRGEAKASLESCAPSGRGHT